MTGKSTSSYYVFLGDTLISWKTYKQKMVYKSSSEVEHTSMVAVTCELTWLIFLFDDLQVHIWDQLILYCDNQVALHIAANHVFHERTKYIELDQ
jgi:heme/copper-type cytochrome/quinol oxidase subunit 2